MKKGTATGEFPQWAPRSKEFNLSQWAKRARRMMKADISTASATMRGYRMRRARLLLAKIERNELHPSAVAGLERDYKREFKLLRKAKQ